MFKINISEKGKTYHLELESEEIQGRKIKEKIEGKEILPALNGYEFEITGMSDKAGFPALEKVEGIMLKKVLLSYEKGMHKKVKREGKKKWANSNPKGLRLRKKARGNTISPDIVQINLNVLKQGSKKLGEIFPEQNQPKEKRQRKKPKILNKMKEENRKNMKRIFIDIREERKRLEDLLLQQKTENEENENKIEKNLDGLELSESISVGQYYTCLNSIIMYKTSKTDEYINRLLKIVSKIR